MALHVALNHRTHYRYDRLIALGPQVVRLRPAPHCRTPILQLFAEDRAEDPLPQLAAGSVRQLPGAPRLPGEDRASFSVEVDLVAEMAVINPFDFFLERDAEHCPFAYEPALEEGARALPRARAGRARCCRRFWRRHRPHAKQRTVDFLVDLNQQLQREIRYLIRLEPGIQTPRRRSRLRSGSCRDTRLAAGADPAQSGPRRPVRLRLPDPAQARREAARRPVGPETTSPICTPGPRSTCRAPAGSASIRPPACSPARATSRWPARRSPSSAAPITGARRAGARSSSASR